MKYVVVDENVISHLQFEIECMSDEKSKPYYAKFDTLKEAKKYLISMCKESIYQTKADIKAARKLKIKDFNKQ